VDALIISDPGIIAVVKKVWPEAEIHLSTQANCTNWQSAKFWYDQGVKRVILGREATLEEIREIKKRVPKLDLEVFVHGAMCMSYSGRCFLSKYFVDRSGNLGDCVQPCRWKFNTKATNKNDEELEGERLFIAEERRPDQSLELVEEEHGSYILNSKDLCLLKYLKDLRDAGVMSFKIEGRAKSAYYQAMVAGIYSRMVNNLDTITTREINKLYKELETKIISRGFTTGFILGEKGEEDTENPHKKIDWQFCGVVVSSDDNKKTSENERVFVKVHNQIRLGDEIEIVMPHYEIKKIKVKKMLDSVTGEELSEAHGGAGGKIIELKIKGGVPEFSVLRRKLV
jgi:putative protease